MKRKKVVAKPETGITGLIQHKVSYYFTITTVITVQLFMLYVFYLMVWPMDILRVKNNQALDVTKQEIQAGDTQGIIFDYDKDTNLVPQVIKQLVCDNAITLLSGQRRLQTGEHTAIVDHIIPPQTPTSDKCHIDIYLDYKVNVLRTISYQFSTKDFKVINPILDGDIQ